MLWKRILIISTVWACFGHLAYSSGCAASAANQISLDLWSTRQLLSPDKLWQFESVGPNSADKKATLYIQNTHSSKKWNVGSIDRDGTVFWSGDSKRVFLRDEYAVDDTKIRVFDVSGARPKEFVGLNRRIQKAIFTHIPDNQTTLWLKFPQVCFAESDSSTIIAVADVPLVPKGKSGKAEPFSLKLTINLNTFRVGIIGNRPIL
jgi:hypothetical protein